MSFQLRAADTLRRAGRACASFLILLALVCPRAAHAQGPEAVAAGAAVAGVVIQAIGGLATWVGQQSDDCYVAALGAAWGKDCNLSKEECTDTGYTYASCSATGDNGCAHGWGQGYASEGLFGSWSRCVITPSAYAWTKSLHTTDDAHNARGWGKAGVDGTSRCKEDTTPGSAPDLLPGVTPAGATRTLAVIPIVAHITVDTLSLSAGTIGGGRATTNLSVKIDGALVWSATASLDQTGAVSLGGALAGAPYASWFDPATNHWEMRLYGYSFDYPVGTVGSLAPLGAMEAATRDVHVEMEGDTDADAQNANSGLTTYTMVTTPMMHAVNALGEPMLKGQRVRVSTPLTVMYGPNQFGVAMSDCQLYDPQSGLSVGVLDFSHVPPFPAGTQVIAQGIVTHHEGRTVLCAAELQPTGQSGPLSPPLPMNIAQLLGNAEQREGSLITINGAHIVGGAWPTAREGGLLRVTDPSGAQIDVELDADTDIDGSAPPAGAFQLTGFLSQYDPEDSPNAPRRTDLSVASATPMTGGPGYFEGYRLRPRWRADIAGPTAGAPDPITPVDPGLFQLRQNQPNPFNPVTRIGFRLAQEGPARLRVFSIDGRLVRTLVDGRLSAGEQSVAWDGRDDVGQPLPSGLYLYTFEAAGQRQTRKMLMTK